MITISLDAPHRWSAARHAAVAAIALVVLSACGKDPDELVSSAKQYISAKDPNAAVIQLKNALQARPEHAEARFLLGRLSAQSGDFETAVKEYERARGAGYPEDQVVPELAGAMLRLGQAQELVDKFSAVKLNDPRSQAVLLAVLGDALQLTDKPKEAEAAYREALAKDPGDSRARIGVARIQASRGDLEGARSALDAVIGDHPESADAHALLAAISANQANAENAIDEYRAAVKANPREAMNHFRLISLLIQQRRVDDARQALETMKKGVGGRQVLAIYLQSYLDFAEKKDDAAAEGIANVIAGAPNFLPARLLACAIHLRKGDLNQALQHAGVVLAAQPNNALARRLAASAHLFNREPDKALELVEPMLSKSPNDSALHALAGQAYLAKGDFERASELFAKTVGESPDDPAARLRLGMSRLGTGDIEQGLADLDKASALDTEGVQADVAVAMARLRQGKPDQALAAAEKIERKQPKSPLGPNLRGGVLMYKGDLAGARTAFEKAVALEPDYLPAVVNLSRLDLGEKRNDQARARLEALVKLRPKDANAYLAQADLLGKTGAGQAEVSKVLEQGIRAASNAKPLQLALINVLSAQKKFTEALAVAAQAEASNPDDPAVITALGALQVAAGKAELAVTTLNRLVSLQPDNPNALIVLANAQSASGKDVDADQTLQKAYRRHPDDTTTAQALVGFRLQKRNNVGAGEIASEFLKRHPDSADAYLLSADVALRQSDWKKAAEHLRKSQQIRPDAKAVIALHAALRASGDAPGAGNVVADWLKKVPKDLLVRGYLAENALKDRDYRAAMGYYRTMHDIDPRNSVILNNMAWTASQLKDPKAMDYAEQAYKLQPENAAILDTLGMIQLEAGQRDKALETMRRASELSPDSVTISLNLARAYARTGKADQAKVVLEKVERDNPNLSGLKEVVARIREEL